MKRLIITVIIGGVLGLAASAHAQNWRVSAGVGFDTGAVAFTFGSGVDRYHAPAYYAKGKRSRGCHKYAPAHVSYKKSKKLRHRPIFLRRPACAPERVVVIDRRPRPYRYGGGYAGCR